MKKLLLFICILLFVGVNAQIPEKKTLVADETWAIKSGKTSFRIITCNDEIAKMIMNVQGITKYTSSQKSDRNGYYWEKSYYFNNSSWNTIVKLFNN